MKNDLNDFLKIAIKNNKIRPIEESFVEYPVEKEIHQGDPNFFLHEEPGEYYK